METNGLDDYLKKRFGSQQASIDLERLWSTIEPELPPENRGRKPLVWWWLASLFMVLIIGLAGDSVVHPHSGMDRLQKSADPSSGKEIPSKQAAEAGKQGEPLAGDESIISNEEEHGGFDSGEGYFARANSTWSITPLTLIPNNTIVQLEANPPIPIVPAKPTGVESFALLPPNTRNAIDRSNPELLKLSIPKPIHQSPTSRWELDITQMIGKPFYRFEPLSEEFQSLAAQKESSLEPSWVLSTSLVLGYKLWSNLRVKTGLSFTWNYEEFSHSYSRDTLIQKSTTTAYYVEAPNDTTFFNEDQSVHRTIYRELTHFNRQTIIQVPIGISYQFDYLSQRLELETGALLNLRIHQQGKTLSNAGEIVDLGTFQPNTGMDLGWYGQVGIVFRPKKRINYVLQAQAAYLPNVGLPDEEALRQQYFLLGGKMGLRYRW